MSRHADITAAMAALDAEYSAKIPAQQKREEENRAVAFFADTVPIAGVECRPVCLRDVRILTEAGCVFLAGGDKLNLFESAGTFLEWQRVDRRNHWFNRRKFQNALARKAKFVGEHYFIQAVHQYIEDIFQDRPAHKESPAGRVAATESNWCYEAALIDQLGSRYAWCTPDYVLSAPIAQLRQYLNIMHAEQCAKNGERATFDLKSKSLFGEYIAKRNALAGELHQMAQNETSTANA